MPNQNQKNVISFSVDSSIANEIEKQAKKQNMSTAKFVRDIVLAIINDEDDDE